MVPQPSLPGVPVAKETDEVLYSGDQGAQGSGAGGGVFRRGAELSCISLSVLLIYCKIYRW